MGRRVWLRHGDDKRSFPVKKVGKSENRVLVQPVAEVWNLEASTISIGENCLDPVSVDVEEMRELAAESGQAGDGQSRESAIEIRGRKREEKDLLAILNAQFAERLQAAKRKRREPMSLYEKAKRSYRGPTREEKDRAARHMKWQIARSDVFFGPGCMYEYSRKLLSNEPRHIHDVYDERVKAFERLMFRLLRPFVGTLHVFSSDQQQQQQQVEDGHCVVGMVTLWKLDGACLTAYDCVKDALSNNKLLFVSLQPVLGKKLVYQCKAKVLGSWAVLQPVEPDKIDFNFTECACLGVGPRPAPWILYTFSLEGGKLTLVKAGSIWSKGNSQTLLSTSRLCTLGAPLYTTKGKLSGIVTSLSDLDKEPDSVHTNKCYRMFYQVLLEGLKSKQVLHNTWTPLPNPLVQWFRDHPIEEVCPLEEVAA